jgi:hypothetical protein
MSDQLTSLFDHLRGQQPPAPFASPAAVRRRGRQRAHRQALAAGTAAFAVAGLAVGLPWAVDLDQRGGPTDGASPAVSAGSTAAPRPGPTATGVPEGLMLPPTDFGPGVRVLEPDDQGPDGPDWPWAAPACPQFRAADYPTQADRLSVRLLTYVEGGSSLGYEWVERYPAGRGPAAFQEVLRVLARCPSYRELGLPVFDPGTGQAYANRVLARDIGGAESVLVRQRLTPVGIAGMPEQTRYFVAVRVGDLIATVRLDRGSEAEARTLGERAAARLG